MRKLIIDANNIANMAYHQAKNVVIKDIKEKFGSDARFNPEVKDEIHEFVSRSLRGLTLYIFFNILHRYIKDNKRYQFYIVWDGRYGSVWRKNHNEDYKANRDHSKDSFYSLFIESILIEKDILDNYPVYQLKFKEVEADDIIYNLCVLFPQDEIKVVTSDGDLLQLVQKFNNVKVWHPKKKKIEEAPEYDIVLYKSIVGDSSDNISGLDRFGPKKAIKAISENLENLSEEQKKIVDHNKIIIDLSLNPNVKKNESMVIDELQATKISWNPDKVKKMYFEYKLADFLKKWDSITDLLRQLEKESIDGGVKKES